MFRGLTIVAMILVNNPGSWGSVYAPLRHAEWHGWTPTDLIFPFFLFVVGVVIPFALGRRLAAGVARGVIVARAARRAAILFGLGLFLSGFPFALFGPRTWERLLETWRIPGVLQRIALCYLAASVIFLGFRRTGLKVWIVGLLLGYWLLMTLVPVPGLGPPNLDSKGDHLAGWLDRQVFGSHVWVSSKVYDPEGVLSTLPAIATCLLGVVAGMLLMSPRKSVEKVRLLLLGAGLLIVGGYVWDLFLPINKALWTSSYTLLTAGLALLVLALCFWFFDLRRHPRIARPLVIYGVNAITVFVGSGLLAKTLIYIKVGGYSLQSIVHQRLFASWLAPYPASLGYALAWIVGWFLVLVWMDRRGWHLKI